MFQYFVLCPNFRCVHERVSFLLVQAMPVEQPPPQNAGERRAEDARVGADDAVPGVVGRGAALRAPEPPRQRQQRLLRLPGQAQEGGSGCDWHPSIANCSCETQNLP